MHYIGFAPPADHRGFVRRKFGKAVRALKLRRRSRNGTSDSDDDEDIEPGNAVIDVTPMAGWDDVPRFGGPQYAPRRVADGDLQCMPSEEEEGEPFDNQFRIRRAWEACWRTLWHHAPPPAVAWSVWQCRGRGRRWRWHSTSCSGFRPS